MRRSAATFLSLILSVALAGCQKPEQEEDLQEPSDQTALMQPDYYTADPAAVVTADDYTAVDDGYSSASLTATGGGRTHLVAKGDTLYGLARQYYNNQGRWKDIYAANGDRVKDPNLIYVGQELVIP